MEQTTVSAGSNYRLGDLMVAIEMISADCLTEALSVAQATGLPMGRVLVMSGFIDERQLRAAVECQTLLRQRSIDLELVGKAVRLMGEKQTTLEQALETLGWSEAVEQTPTILGNLLVSSGFVSGEQLEYALEQSSHLGMPFGRILVLSGVLSESLLTSALNTQQLLRENILSLEEAIECLKSARNRHDERRTPPVERGFYELPRRGVRLGELLVMSGALSEAELNNAVEVGLVQNKLIGEVLVELKLISKGMLSAALHMQQLVAAGTIKVVSASAVLTRMMHTGANLQEALALVPKHSGTEEVSLEHFLKYTSCITDADIEKALDVGRRNAKLLSQMLLFSGALDDHALRGAELCVLLMRETGLPIEQACIAFALSQREQITIREAMHRLRWSQDHDGVMENLSREEEQGQDDGWTTLLNDAETAAKNDSPDAEEKLQRLVELAHVHEGQGPRFAHAMELLAAYYCRCQRYEQADSTYRYVLQLRKQALGMGDLSVALTASNLAKVCYFLKKYTEAEELCQIYIQVCTQVLGEVHPDVACGWHNLATIYHFQKNYAAAEPCYKQALTICQDQLGAQHPTTNRLMRNYAKLLREANRADEAEVLDRCKAGSVSGSWKSLIIPSSNELLDHDSMGDEDEE